MQLWMGRWRSSIKEFHKSLSRASINFCTPLPDSNSEDNRQDNKKKRKEISTLPGTPHDDARSCDLVSHAADKMAVVDVLLSALLVILLQVSGVEAFDAGDAIALVLGLVIGILGICACLGYYARRRAS